MASTRHPIVRIPISRVVLYPAGTFETPSVELSATHVVVQTNVIRMGAVTLAVTNDAPDLEADHLEIDLDPSAARQLAAQIQAAIGGLSGH